MSRRRTMKKQQIDQRQFYTCHLCTKISDQIAKCSKDRCKLAFCFQCIVSKLNNQFLPSQYKKQFWICYACGGSCKCILCKGLVSERKTKKSNKINQNSSLQDSLQNQDSISKDTPKDSPSIKKTKPIKKMRKKNSLSSEQKNKQNQKQNESQKIQIEIKYQQEVVELQQVESIQKPQLKNKIFKRQQSIQLFEDQQTSKKMINKLQESHQQKESIELKDVKSSEMHYESFKFNQAENQQQMPSYQSKQKNEDSQASSSQSQFQQIIQNKIKKGQKKVYKKSQMKKRKTRRTQFQLLNAMHRTLQQPHVSQSSQQLVQCPVHIQHNQQKQIKKQWLNIDQKILRNRLLMDNLCLKVIFSRQNLKPQWDYILNKRKQMMQQTVIKER